MNDITYFVTYNNAKQLVAQTKQLVAKTKKIRFRKGRVTFMYNSRHRY